MLKILSRITGSGRAEIRDAKKIYAKTMRASRNPAFFGPDMVADDFDGRMEVLCLNLAVLTHRLRGLGEQGLRLSQALYDAMVADFDIALREECLTDSGVSRRIKPMVLMYLTRVKTYCDALELKQGKEAAIEDILRKLVLRAETGKDTQLAALLAYVMELDENMAKAGLGDIASTAFSFPQLKKL